MDIFNTGSDGGSLEALQVLPQLGSNNSDIAAFSISNKFADQCLMQTLSSLRLCGGNLHKVAARWQPYLSSSSIEPGSELSRLHGRPSRLSKIRMFP